MPSLWAHFHSNSACVWHRCLLPARFCEPTFKPLGWEFQAGDGLPGGHDVFVLHGLPAPELLLQLANHKRRGARVVWGVDDDWISIPDWNPAKLGEVGLGAYQLMKSMVDWIIVSTPKLVDTFADVSHKVLCAPNLLDLSRFPTPGVREEGGEKFLDINNKMKLPVRVVWAGGPTHKGDVEPVVDALDRLMSRFGPDKLIVAWFGPVPHHRLLTKHLNRSLFHQDQVPFASYQMVLNSIDPHVYLCPLAPICFNESKSNLRVIEGWALCAAPVASDWGEYKCVGNGRDGRLVHAEDEWYSALHRMATDHEFRLECAAHGRMRVEREFDWNSEACREPWVRAFETILGVTV